MDVPENCELRELLPEEGGKLELKKLDPGQCIFIKTSFHALKPEKYTIQADLTYNEGDPITIATSTLVEPKLEAEFNIACIMLAHTLTRLSLNFSLE